MKVVIFSRDVAALVTAISLGYLASLLVMHAGYIGWIVFLLCSVLVPLAPCLIALQGKMTAGLVAGLSLSLSIMYQNNFFMQTYIAYNSYGLTSALKNEFFNSLGISAFTLWMAFLVAVVTCDLKKEKL